MHSAQYFTFKGLDTRRLPGLSDQQTARVAKNLYLTSGRLWATRPGSRKVAELPEETRGLYTAGGVLRTVAPAGYADIFNQQSPSVFFDFVGDGTAYPRDDIEAFISMERMGSSGEILVAGAPAYVVIRRRSTGKVEHHWCANRPVTPAGTVANKVALPFVPSGPVVKLAGKMWTPCRAAGTVPFSSTEFGPTDWSTSGDAGFLPVLANAPGARDITALGYLQSVGAGDDRHPGLVVFFADGFQVWAVDPDPLNHFLTGIFSGVGTDAQQSVVNVLGDPVFFDRGGFASLRISQRAGALDSAKVGAPIEDLTRGVDPTTITAAVWWERLGCYLCAVGSEVYCWKYDPLAKVDGWSVWTLPAAVTDLVVLNGDLYARTSDHAVIKFSEEYDTDEGGTPIAFELRTQFLHGNAPGHYCRFDALSLYQEGAASISYFPEATEDTEVQVYETDGQTRLHRLIPLMALSDSLALRFQGRGQWRLSGFVVHCQPLRR